MKCLNVPCRSFLTCRLPLRRQVESVLVPALPERGEVPRRRGRRRRQRLRVQLRRGIRRAALRGEERMRKDPSESCVESPVSKGSFSLSDT